MLRKFSYLDGQALQQYLSALEGGLARDSTVRTASKGTGGGKLGVKVVEAHGERTVEQERSQTLADTDESRFARLVDAADADPDALGWVDVRDPEVDFAGIGIGAMISWECELFVPENVRALARSGEMLPAIELMQSLAPMAETLGLDLDGIPSVGELDAYAGLLRGMNASLVAVGDDEETDWSVAGTLQDAWLAGEIEGRGIVVGKVQKVIKEGNFQPFLTFPGMNLVSREERRRMNKIPPAEGKEAEYLGGPALVLDVLAIYR